MYTWRSNTTAAAATAVIIAAKAEWSTHSHMHARAERLHFFVPQRGVRSILRHSTLRDAQPMSVAKTTVLRMGVCGLNECDAEGPVPSVRANVEFVTIAGGTRESVMHQIEAFHACLRQCAMDNYDEQLHVPLTAASSPQQHSASTCASSSF
jgi:hypothetical protein